MMPRTMGPIERFMWFSYPCSPNGPRSSDAGRARRGHAGVMAEGLGRKLLDLMLEWAPNESDRRKMLVENPAELYGF